MSGFKVPKLLALLVCGIVEIGRSRMVFPGVGSSKARNKSNDIKVDPTFYSTAY